MSCPYMCGCIALKNKSIDESRELPDAAYVLWAIGEAGHFRSDGLSNEIHVDGEYHEDELEELFGKLKKFCEKNDYIMDGSIENTDDPDGTSMVINGLSYEWKGNSDYARENAVSEASDDELVSELASRGYMISKIEQ